MPELTAGRLARLYHEEDLNQREIAERFNLSQPCISKKMKKYGIKSDHNGWWTEEEIELMKECYPERSEKLVSETGRSWNAIKLKAIKLGLARDQEEYRNSEEVAERLRKNAEEKAVKADFNNSKKISYVLGVIDGDGFHDNSGTIGLETTSESFAEKFAEALKDIGLNSNQGSRRGKNTVWASSKSFVDWLKDLDYNSKQEWLEEEGDIWKYIEGAYDSDGNFTNPGPRICSYDKEEKKFLKNLLEKVGLNPRIHSNNVYVPVSEMEKFFTNVDPVYEKRRP